MGLKCDIDHMMHGNGHPGEVGDRKKVDQAEFKNEHPNIEGFLLNFDVTSNQAKTQEKEQLPFGDS